MRRAASLTSQYPPTDSDKSLSSSLDTSSSSDFSWLAGNFESSNGTSHYGSSSSDKQEPPILAPICDRDVPTSKTTAVEDIQPTATDQWFNATLDEDELELRYPPTPTPSGQFAQAPSVRHLLLSCAQRLNVYHNTGARRLDLPRRSRNDRLPTI
jgi:hypothetical protein